MISFYLKDRNHRFSKEKKSMMFVFFKSFPRVAQVTGPFVQTFQTIQLQATSSKKRLFPMSILNLHLRKAVECIGQNIKIVKAKT